MYEQSQQIRCPQTSNLMRDIVIGGGGGTRTHTAIGLQIFLLLYVTIASILQAVHCAPFTTASKNGTPIALGFVTPIILSCSLDYVFTILKSEVGVGLCPTLYYHGYSFV